MKELVSRKEASPKSKAPNPSKAEVAAGSLSNMDRQRLVVRPVIGAANDAAEYAADSIARRVMQGGHLPMHRAPVSSSASPLSAPPDFSLPQGRGTALAPAEQRFFEARFGQSLSQVRLHTDSETAHSARLIGAQAFTAGNDIGFAHGRYVPNSESSRLLLAHELAHVVHKEPGDKNLVRRLNDGPATDRWVEARGREMHESAERERRLTAAWTSSHQSRFRGDLSAEGATLDEEISRSDTALVGLRARTLSSLSRTTVDLPLQGQREVNSDMPEGMDLTYGAARLAVDSLSIALSATEPPTSEVIDAARGPINSFYYMAVQFAQDVEAADSARAAEDLVRYQREMAAMDLMGDFDMDPVDRRATAMTRVAMQPRPAHRAAPVQSTALEPLAETARNADSEDSWQTVVTQFAQAESHLDQSIQVALAARPALASLDSSSNFNYYVNLRRSQEQLQSQHASALRIQAIFYPRNQMVVADGESVSVANGIPWQLYLYHTASEAPNGVARASDHWQLRDLTSGRSLPSFASSMEDSERVARGETVDPPTQMFQNFAEIVEFPDGILYWTMPLGGIWHVPTSDDWGLWEWLQAIGITLAALALIAGTAGAATPVVVGLGVASAGFSVAATLAERSERQRLGTWTVTDEDRAIISIGADIVSALSLGLGSVVSAAGRAGRVATFAAANARAFTIMRGGARILAVADLGANMAQITYASSDLVQAFAAIQNQPGLTDEERNRAIGSLARSALLVGSMGVLSVRGAMTDIHARGRVAVDVGEDGALRVAREAGDVPAVHGPVAEPHVTPHGGTDALPVRDIDGELRALGAPESSLFNMTGPVHVDPNLHEGDVRVDLVRTENGLVDSVRFRVPEGFNPHSAMGADLLQVHNDVVRAYSGLTGRFRLAIARFQAALRGLDPPPLHLQMELWKHRRLASFRMERASAAGISREQLLELQTDIANIQRRIDDVSDVIATPSRWHEYSESSVGTMGHIPGTEHLPPLPPNHQWVVGSDGVIRMAPRAGHVGARFDVEYGADGVATGRLTNAASLNSSGVLGAQLVNPTTGAVNQTVARNLRSMGYDVSPNGDISLSAASGAGSMKRGRVVLPLAVDAAGNIRATGVRYGGDLSRFSDSDLMTAGTGGISSIEINPSRTPGFGDETTISGTLMDGMPRTGPIRPGRAPSYNNSYPYRPGELGLGGRFEIAHLWGPGFGDEAAAGMALAPRTLNQVWQNRGIEELLRSFRDQGRALGGGEVRLVATARNWDLSSLSAADQAAIRGLSSTDLDMLQVPFLREVSYRFELVNNGTVVRSGPRVTLTVGAPHQAPAVDVDILGGWGML